MVHNPTLQAQEIQALKDEEQMQYLVTTYEIEEAEPLLSDEEIQELFTSSFPNYQKLVIIHDNDKINVHAHIKKLSGIDLEDLRELGFEFKTLTSRPETKWVNSFETTLTSYVTVKFRFNPNPIN